MAQFRTSMGGVLWHSLELVWGGYYGRLTSGEGLWHCSVTSWYTICSLILFLPHTSFYHLIPLCLVSNVPYYMP